MGVWYIPVYREQQVGAETNFSSHHQESHFASLQSNIIYPGRIPRAGGERINLLRYAL